MKHLGSSYVHIELQQQQMGMTTLEQQDWDMDPFRQGLTPPQMPGDHMHPYGKRSQSSAYFKPFVKQTWNKCTFDIAGISLNFQ